MDQNQKFARPSQTPLMTTRGHAYLCAQLDLARDKSTPEHVAQNEFLDKIESGLRAIEALPVFESYGYLNFLNDVDPEDQKSLDKVRRKEWCHAQFKSFHCIDTGTFSNQQDYTSWEPSKIKTPEEAREWLRLASMIGPYKKELQEWANLHQVSFNTDTLASALRMRKKIANNSLSFKMRADTSIEQTTSFVIFVPSKDQSRPSGYMAAGGHTGVFSSARLFETSIAARTYLKQRKMEKSGMVVEVETTIKRIDQNPGNLFSDELVTALATLERKQLMDALEKSSTDELKRIVAERGLLEGEMGTLKPVTPKKRAM